MTRSSAAFTRDEVSKAFGLAPAVVDALIEEGHLLCRVRNGEPLIPLDQLEAFFREGLVSVYRAEAGRVAEPERQVVVAAPAPARAPEVTNVPMPVIAAPRDPEPESDDELEIEEEPAKDSPELRAAPRYVPTRQISGIFNEVRFSIVQLSTTGLRIRHDAELMPGDEAKLSFALLNPPRSIVMKARVVWTSLARFGDAGATFHISGLRVTEHGERLSRAIDALRAAHELQPERREQERRRPSAEPIALEGISDDEIAAVMSAVQKFSIDPLEANRWYSRARFALSDQQVRREAPTRARDREEVLGLWEYLDRQIEIPKIAGVVSWMKKARAGA